MIYSQNPNRTQFHVNEAQLLGRVLLQKGFVVSLSLRDSDENKLPPGFFSDTGQQLT